MRVYYAIPSARPPEEALPNLRQWQERGYAVVLQRDPHAPDMDCCACVQRTYTGYAEAVNYLVNQILATDPQAEWIVTGGDDMLPDPHKSAEEIARECSEYFRDLAWPKRWSWDSKFETPEDALAAGAYAEQKKQALWSADLARIYSTFGVMQPTGDRWLVNGPGTKPGSECVAGSPWMGREWCRRINGGRGPLWPEYFHCGEDEELMEVAIKYGVFWQRQDLTHHHAHWGRPREGEKLAHVSRMPKFLARANSREEWCKMKATLAARKAAGWPGTEPIP